jgi:hypothetical protein
VARAIRRWWHNCYGAEGIGWTEDPDIPAIDAMEDALRPLDEDTVRIRELIGIHESCHHKAERHVELILQAIRDGRTATGPRTRPPTGTTARERAWRASHDLLSAWSQGQVERPALADIEGVPAGDLLQALGEPTPLARWQVGRVLAKVTRWLEPDGSWRDEPVIGEGPADSPAFRAATEQTIIRDTVDGRPAEIALACAIDHLRPCNWNYPRNLQVILLAVGGDLHPPTPYASCSRNITLAPSRERMRALTRELGAFAGAPGQNAGGPSRLGEPTPVRQWLAASLRRTLELHLGL